MELRDYQKEIAYKGHKIDLHNILYLAMAVRTGKTATCLEVCKLSGAKRVQSRSTQSEINL